jgi:hypothetical protein
MIALGGAIGQIQKPICFVDFPTERSDNRHWPRYRIWYVEIIQRASESVAPTDESMSWM